jgi:hypothetical protein
MKETIIIPMVVTVAVARAILAEEDTEDAEEAEEADEVAAEEAATIVGIDKSCLDNNYNNYYDEIAYPFSKIIKLKHEPGAAQENKPVQYTADIILEIKNRDGEVVPMRALLDTGTTAAVILREFVGKGRARTNTNKRTKWKTLGGTFTTNYESLLDFKFPELSTNKVITWQAHVDDKTSSK